MAEINKPQNLSKTWARTGNKSEPTDIKKDQGFGKEIPTCEQHNYLWNRSDTAVAHINQHGVPIWDSTTEYIANKAVVMGSDGNFYFSKTTTTNVDPVADTSFINWQLTHIGNRANRPKMNLSLQNSWTGNLSVAIADGVIYFSGAPVGGTTTIFTTIATLPVAYRPTATKYFSVMLDDTGSSGWLMIPMQVLSTGEIQPRVTLANNTGIIMSGSALL